MEKHPACGTAPGLIGERLALVIGVLGLERAAALLKITPEQLNHWSTGSESPNPGQAIAVLDLDHLIARASLLWDLEVVAAWFEGANQYLAGARPVDVVQVRGPHEVLAALESETQFGMG